MIHNFRGTHEIENRIRHMGLEYTQTKDQLMLTKDNFASIRTEHLSWQTESKRSGFIRHDVKSDIEIELEEGRRVLGSRYTVDDAILACEGMKKKALLNYKYSKQYFSMLSRREFNNQLKTFLEEHPEFVEIKNIQDYKPQKVAFDKWVAFEGIYIMVLGKYKQIYIGQTSELTKRIKQHWGVRAENDTERIEYWESSYRTLKSKIRYGESNEYNAVMTIDSFGPLDTTQIFFLNTTRDGNTKEKEAERMELESEYIRSFDSKFLCNRKDEKTGKYFYREEGLAAAKAKLEAIDSKRRKHTNMVTHFGVRIKNTAKTPKREQPKFSDYFMKFKELGYSEILDIDTYRYVPGMYILVLEEHELIYIGSTNNSIRSSIVAVWSKCKGTIEGVDDDKITIKDFKPLDTTKIFVKPNVEYRNEKERLISIIHKTNLLNRR